MEYRKLISFGKSSYVISLPKSWVIQNKLVKGDLVYLEESGPGLILSKKDSPGSPEERERIILVDGKDIGLVEREVNTAYILNCRKIILKGKAIKTHIKELQRIIQNLIALEIMEQASDSLMAKDFLNMDKVSMEELIRKMDVVTRTMLREASTILQEDTYENINERDKDVNRLHFLLCRTIQYNLENPVKAMKNFKLSPIDLLTLQFVGEYVESIADEAKRIARLARGLTLQPKDRKTFEEIMEKVIQYYMESMKVVYTKDPRMAIGISEARRDFNKEIGEFQERLKSVEGLTLVCTRLWRTISHIHHLGWIIYTTRME